MKAALRLAVVAALLLAACGADAAPLEELAHATSFQAEAFVDIYPHKANTTSQSLTDGEEPTLWTRMSARTYAQLSETVRFNLAGYLVFSEPELGRQGTVSLPGNHAVHPRFSHLTAFNIVHNVSDLTVLVGKAELNIGVADLYSPTDRFDSHDYSNPLHVQRLGRWQARADRQIGDDTLSLVLLPFDDPDIRPSHRSRWSAGGNGTDPVTVFNAVPDRYDDGGIGQVGVLAKYLAVRDGYDVFSGFHYGPAAYPTIEQSDASPLDLHKVWPDAVSGFGGAVATIKNWRLYGETLYQHVPGRRDQDVLRYTAGISPRFPEWASASGLEDISVTAEYANEWIARDETAPQVSCSSAAVRPYRNSILGKVNVKIDGYWSVNVTTTQRIDGNEYTRGAGVEYRYSDNLTISARGGVLGGSYGTPLGLMEKNDFISAGIDYRF